MTTEKAIELAERADGRRDGLGMGIVSRCWEKSSDVVRARQNPRKEESACPLPTRSDHPWAPPFSEHDEALLTSCIAASRIQKVAENDRLIQVLLFML